MWLSKHVQEITLKTSTGTTLGIKQYVFLLKIGSTEYRLSTDVRSQQKCILLSFPLEF